MDERRSIAVGEGRFVIVHHGLLWYLSMSFMMIFLVGVALGAAIAILVLGA